MRNTSFRAGRGTRTLKIDGCMLYFGLTEPAAVAAVDLNEDQFLINGYR